VYRINQITQPFYYELAIIGSVLKNLTYFSFQKLNEGDVVIAPLRGKPKEGVVIKTAQKPEFECLEIVSETLKFFTKENLITAKFISTYYFCALGEALALMQPHLKNAKKSEPFLKEVNLKLSNIQKEAKEFINKNDSSLLFGDTGSGKTEIYISLIKDILSSGGDAIFLMPEIGLTPQMEKRLKEHFGDFVEVYHSKLTKKAKDEVLEKIQNSKIKVVAGPRSALFLPLQNLKLIVVDEESDESYKSSSRPRYNAKDVALWMGKKFNIKVVLGSATPSPTSYKNLPTFRLKGTFFSSSKRVIFDEGLHEVSEEIILKIEDSLKKDNQVIFFVPTRANFKTLLCKECKERIECPFCSVSLSLHLSKSALVCHYCNFSQPIATTCPNCKNESLEARKIGTVEVINELTTRFPNAKIAQFDRDSIKSTKALKKLLNDFNDEKIDILVGTQMLSKGHDYHNVNLSVIVGIDSLLFMPDFRANEKALSLAMQVAGRSGRKGEGEVVLQTQNREFFALYMNDYERFLKDELLFRQDLYPPFVRFCRLLISHKNEKTCIDEVTEALKKLEKLNIEVVGSGACGILKIANKFRYHILLRDRSAKALLRASRAVKSPLIEVDMDPYNFS